MNCQFYTIEDIGYMEEETPDRHWMVKLFVIDYTRIYSMEAGILKLLQRADDDPYEESFSSLKLPNALIREYTYDAFSQEFELVYPGIADFYYLRFQYWGDTHNARWVRAETMKKNGTVWNMAQHHGYWHPGILLDMYWRSLLEVSNDTERSAAEQKQFV